MKRLDANKCPLIKLVSEATEGQIIKIKSYYDVTNSLVAIGQALDVAAEKKVTIYSEKEPWLSTGRWNDVIKNFIDLHKQIIKERTKRGQAIARANGSKIGRPQKITPSVQHKLNIIKEILNINPDAPIYNICKDLNMIHKIYYR